jgi:NADPH:quinone reductase-like Zn-dependent oxidoreductase
VQGVYPGFQPASLPAVPGLEGAGVVADSNGTELKEGTRGICFFNAKDGNGSWQEYVAIPAANFIPVPDSVPDESAAQFLVNPVTVVGMLEELDAPAGEYILQSAAGSTLGRQLITVAKKRGLKTINLVRRPEQAAELKALGADEVLCTETDDIVARVKEITGGKGAWGAVDAVGGPLTQRISGSVRDGGSVLIYGAMSGLEFTGSIVDVLFRSVTVKGFWLNVFLGKISAERKGAVFSEVISWLADGSLVPFSGQRFPLSDVVAAVQASQATARGGKVLLM